MKTNCWLILGTMLATTAVAQVNQPKPTAPATHAAAAPVAPAPATPAPAVPATPVPTSPPLVTPEAAASDSKTNAPAKKTLKARKKVAKPAKHEESATEKAKKAEKNSVKNEEKKALEAEAMPALVLGSATVVGETVNLRGQAGLNGEVVGHVKKGDTVTVLAEINLDKPKAGEPAKWAKISLPASEKVWVNAKYVDATNNVIVAKKLNLRGGPGENFSVLGVVEKGASVTPVTTKGDWIQIQPPANAFAFIAASLLKQEGAAPAATPPPVAVLTPTPAPVAEAPVIVPHVVAPPPVVLPPPVAPAMPVMSMPMPTPILVDTDTNPPPRIVTHEGSVRDSVSPVAPSNFELFDPENNKAIDYLNTTSTNLNIGRYNGMHITVTGQEEMDPRWKDTPVLTIKEIHVISAPKSPLAPAGKLKK